MIYSVRNVLRLFRKYSVISLNHVRTTNTTEYSTKQKSTAKKDYKSLLQQYKEKIIFSSYLEHEKLQLGYFKYHLQNLKRAKRHELKILQEKSLPPLPVALQYYVEKDRLLKTESDSEPEIVDELFQLPFGKAAHIEIDEKENPLVASEDHEFNRESIDQWMTNYESFDDSRLSSDECKNEDIDDNNEWSKYYGTPDLNAKISQVSCGGCGAFLHCNDPAIPGYLPSELFKGQKVEELKTMECQRCHFLKEYNIALDVTVQPEEYEKLLQSIRYVKSLIVLMVDLLDFPCSIWPDILDVIGKDRPIIIVGNKVDLLPGDSIGYLTRVKKCLLSEIKKTKLKDANIKYIGLISAKTGYGVEDLISAMFKTWLYKGDVFLVGCTNVGKSSLFNALLQSDYCKVHAVDIVKRATVSRWPGTTLNLLKFPINRPSGWKIRQRSNRLMSEKKLMKVEKKIRKDQVLGKTLMEAPSLIGHIGRTFTQHEVVGNIADDRHNNMMVMDEKNHLFRNSKWFFDTPGVVHPDQTLSLLSTEELLLTIPKKLIRPQTYYLHRGSTFFIGGLARVDLVDCTEACRFTIFCSENLPITVVDTEWADEIYEKFVGTELLAVPGGGEERLKSWPGLTQREGDIVFTGDGPDLCCGDVVLSSAGWAGVSTRSGARVVLRAWGAAPGGLRTRTPSLLPYAVTLKGKRIRDTPAYMVGNSYAGNEA